MPIRFRKEIRVITCAVCAAFPRMHAEDIDRRTMAADLLGIPFGEVRIKEKTHARRRL